MTTIDKIRAEIERRLKYTHDWLRGDENRHSNQTFVSKNYYKMKGDERTLDALLSFLSTLESEKPMNQEGLEEEISRYLRVECSSDDEPSVSEIARYFAKWGAERQKEQMLKEAVEGFIFQSADYYPKQLIAGYDGELGMGDKVRIIIVNE